MWEMVAGLRNSNRWKVCGSDKKINGRGKQGVRRARLNVWLLSSPQQPRRRRIHQPSLLPRNIHGNAYAVQVYSFIPLQLTHFRANSRIQRLISNLIGNENSARHVKLTRTFQVEIALPSEAAVSVLKIVQ